MIIVQVHSRHHSSGKGSAFLGDVVARHVRPCLDHVLAGELIA
jgi:hypothetical protein